MHAAVCAGKFKADIINSLTNIVPRCIGPKMKVSCFKSVFRTKTSVQRKEGRFIADLLRRRIAHALWLASLLPLPTGHLFGVCTSRCRPKTSAAQVQTCQKARSKSSLNGRSEERARGTCKRPSMYVNSVHAATHVCHALYLPSSRVCVRARYTLPELLSLKAFSNAHSVWPASAGVIWLNALGLLRGPAQEHERPFQGGQGQE